MITVTVGVNGGKMISQQVDMVLGDADVDRLVAAFVRSVLSLPQAEWMQLYADDGVYQGIEVWEKKEGVWSCDKF